jgi:hypothetical protein
MIQKALMGIRAFSNHCFDFRFGNKSIEELIDEFLFFFREVVYFLDSVECGFVENLLSAANKVI